ncbi:MAG: glycosyltransferase [Actinobacteria bacterium]|nr:glycosyltransferase [Actinomycetota bacterium]
MPGSSGPVVGCISLEPWDEVWRRNQHFAWQLVEQGLVSRLVFVEPPRLGERPRRWSPQPGIQVVRPLLPAPKRLGGLQLAGVLLRQTVLRRIDVLWVNDATLGRHCVRKGVQAVYDVTDDWRTFDNPPYIRQRIVSAEDALARQAGTIVCSEVLAQRWEDRYGARPPVVQNAVDLSAFKDVIPHKLDGPGPHVGYVGTLHSQRLDVDLVLRLARELGGAVHLVGPDSLDSESRQRLAAEPRVHLHGPVPASEVPGWMTAMDVLVCPHLVNDFTLSLDAIKAHEYAAAGRPVVATPTSGFQLLDDAGIVVAPAEGFVAAAGAAVGGQGPVKQPTGWRERAREFAGHLLDPEPACA